MKVFISQAALDGWLSADRADLHDDGLTLRGSLVRLSLVPASRFCGVAGGGADLHNLVGKVKNEAAIVALGAEAYMTSVLLGEIAYDVEPGFIATPADVVDVTQLLLALRLAGT